MTAICVDCGREFEDKLPDAPLKLCLKCEAKRVESERTVVGLSSDGGFGPRTHFGHKLGGPRSDNNGDPDANRIKDAD